MSPVASNTYVWKSLPGWNAPFSGRLNGVAAAALAAALASNGANPSVDVLCSVTQRVGHDVPGVLIFSCPCDVNVSPTASLGWKITGVPLTVTCSACSTPPALRSARSLGTKR